MNPRLSRKLQDTVIPTKEMGEEETKHDDDGGDDDEEYDHHHGDDDDDDDVTAMRILQADGADCDDHGGLRMRMNAVAVWGGGG